MNILFILAGLLVRVGLALLLVRHHPPAFSVGARPLPLVLTTVYVFALRQDKPKSHDTDLLETVIARTGWMAPARQPRSPLQ
jgi:hypothetical protein